MTCTEEWNIRKPVISRYLSPAQVEAFGAELDALRKRVRAELGARDIAYIKDVMRWQRGLEVGGRLALEFCFFNPVAWAGGVAALTASKMLNTLEIGHNVMHGQYDWSGDPALQGAAFEWDFLCPGDNWRHLHNVYHHRYTNIVGKDRDIGFGLLRMADAQPWHPVRLAAQPALTLFTAVAMEWGIALYELELGKIPKGKWRWRERKHIVKALAGKILRERGKDYVLFPALAGPFFLPVLAGNFTANLLHNMWWFSLIFCGHFPEDIEMFSKEECADETRAQWYVRQVLSTGNIEGGWFFQLMSGHVGHQIEHHLFPTLPAHRCAEIAPEVRALCEKYGLPYHTGPLRRQLGSALRRVVRHAFPGDAASQPASLPARRPTVTLQALSRLGLLRADSARQQPHRLSAAAPAPSAPLHGAGQPGVPA